MRAEVLGAMVNGVFLLALCFSIFIESLTRLLEPHRIKDPVLILIVGTVGLVINLIGMFMFHSECFKDTQQSLCHFEHSECALQTVKLSLKFIDFTQKSMVVSCCKKKNLSRAAFRSCHYSII